MRRLTSVCEGRELVGELERFEPNDVAVVNRVVAQAERVVPDLCHGDTVRDTAVLGGLSDHCGS